MWKVRIDLVEKNEEYASPPLVQRYVILRQGRIGGMMFERYGGDWLGCLLGRDAVIRMPEIEIPIASFYKGVPFENTDVGQVAKALHWSRHRPGTDRRYSWKSRCRRLGRRRTA